MIERENMNEIQIFNYGTSEIRTIHRDGQTWWVLKDVCEVLGITNPSIVAARLDEDERAKFDLGRQGETNIITESGLYSVILRSDKAEAKRFKRWITHEVLPSIRKRGSYILGQDQLSEEELIARALILANDRIETRERVIRLQSEEIVNLKPKAEFYELAINSKDLLTMQEAAQIIGADGIGQNNLIRFLKREGILQLKGLPMQRFIERGYFRVKEEPWEASDGNVYLTRKTLVTQKGLEFISKRLIERGKIESSQRDRREIFLRRGDDFDTQHLLHNLQMT